MPIVTLDLARAHLHLGAGYPVEQIQPYLDAAVDAASQYLNRALFDTPAELAAAIAGLPAVQTSARSAREQAFTAANALENVDDRRDALHIANTIFAGVREAYFHTLNGMVANPSVISAVLLTLGHLFENREDVVLGATSAELPNGAKALLRPYRREMMP